MFWHQNKIDPEILIFLFLAEEADYGLGLFNKIKDRTEHKIKISLHKLHSKLRSLKRQGYLISYEGESLVIRHNIPRVYYKLSELGLQKFEEYKLLLLGILASPLTIKKESCIPN